ncbi:hypothetical protein COCON_G00234990, partial [Conger conger]
MKRMLGPLLILLPLLTTVSHGTATSCRSPEGEISAQYYGALGQSAYVHLTNTSVDHSGFELQVFFKCENIFTYKQRNKTTRFRSGRNGQFLKNGTLRLDNLTKNHSGVYSIEEFLDGTGMGKRHITLTIQGLGAPVKCTMVHGTDEIDVRMNASLNAASPQNNTEIFFMDRRGEYVSAICKINPYTPNKSSENSQTTNSTCAETVAASLT